MKQFLKFLLILLPLPGVAGGGRLYAQLQGQPLIDSLLKELPKQKEDTDKVNILNGLSFAYRESNPDEGIKYGRQDLELAAKLEWKKGMADANNRLGVNYYIKADYPKALGYYNEALKMDEELDYKKGMASVLGNMGLAYLSQSDYPNALEYDFRALKMDEETGNKNGEASVTVNIGIVYQYQGDYPKALEYYFKALKMHEGTGNKNGEAIVTGNIGNVYTMQGDYPKALEYNFKALKMNEENGNKNGMADNTGNIGAIYSNQHNYTQAVAWHFKAVQMCEEIGDKNSEAVFLEDIGEDYIRIVTHQGNLADAAKMATAVELIPKGKPALLHKAVTFLNKAIAMDKETGSLDNLQQSYYSLSTADSLMGDISGAYYAYIQYTIFKDSVFSAENNKKIIRQGMKYEYQKREDSIKLENAEKEKTAALKFQQQRNYTYMGIAGIICLMAFSFFIIKERRKSDKLLLNILPSEIAKELKNKGATTARHYDNVTVLFTDFVNFTQTGERMSPQALIEELDTCFKTFDEITSKYNVEKIKTIGDAYLAVAGLPTADQLHAEHVVRAAIEINAFMQDRFAKLGSSTFEIRIGIHSGSVVAGIVGVKKFAYDIWGDTVNTAARMEQNSEAGRINVSATTYELVKDNISCEYRGEIEAKGKGMLRMYFING